MAALVLHNDILLFYAKRGIKVDVVLTDIGGHQTAIKSFCAASVTIICHQVFWPKILETTICR